MPHNDYTDPELRFPRLEARIQKVADDAFHIQIWRWEAPGERGPPLVNRRRAGSYEDAKEIIREYGAEHGIEVEPDDITVENQLLP